MCLVVPSRHLSSASSAYWSAVGSRRLVHETAARPCAVWGLYDQAGPSSHRSLFTCILVYIVKLTPFRTQRAKNGPKCVAWGPPTRLRLRRDHPWLGRRMGRSHRMRTPRVWPSGSKVQVLADRVVGDGALADGGRHPLHRLSPSVAGREDSRHARLQRQRGPVEAPRRGRASGRHFAAGEVPVGDDESPVVAPDLRGLPVRVGPGADEDEEGHPFPSLGCMGARGGVRVVCGV